MHIMSNITPECRAVCKGALREVRNEMHYAIDYGNVEVLVEYKLGRDAERLNMSFTELCATVGRFVNHTLHIDTFWEADEDEKSIIFDFYLGIPMEESVRNDFIVTLKERVL